jgi:nitrate reductase alpha subunit
MISLASNPLRRVRASNKVLETLWPKLRKIVVLEWRMNSTTRHADYVLPAAPWYERTNLKWVTPLSPYMVIADQATKPLGESKNDWWIIVRLCKHIQQRARVRGISTVKSSQGLDVRLDRLYDDITMSGEFTEDDEEKVAKAIYDLSSTHKKMTWAEVKKKGFARFERLPEDIFSITNMCDIPEDDTMVPLTYHVRDKVPYPTATRRIQFYLDHPLYEELDEVLPRYKAPPTIGGNHPLIMTGGKTRWSIHSTWRDSETMLRLHRPDPDIQISVKDAADRGIQDGDWVRVYNDIGSFNACAKVSPTMQVGQTLMYHAWESYQFRGKGDMNHVTPTPLNPVELAGGHPHLTYRLISGQSSFYDRDTRVEVEQLPEGKPPT